ncbi:RNA polymerase sigma factor SigM [soil metagenome]
MRGGDRGALDTLLQRHYDHIHRLCRRMCGNDADADDATQDALVAVVRGLASFDGRAAFSTWAHRVTVNACLDELRRRGRRPQPSDQADLTSGPGAFHVAGSLEPGDVVALRLDLDSALAQLAPEVRAAVVLRDVGGHDYAAIAAILDIPVGTVRSRISRGRSRLAAVLGNPSSSPERPTP